MMTTFKDFGLDAVLTRSLEHMKYDQPTPIQTQAIPLAMTGRDIMGSAQTGTGKTAAFSIPLVQHLLQNESSAAIVITPTRELGKQVMEVIQQLLGQKTNIKTAFLIGGDSMAKQNAQLKRRPRIIVGTPGRINDHLKRRSLDLDHTDFLVLDETDRMLDMGFSVQIDQIVKYLPRERQTLMFSATMPSNIMQMADKYLHNPERIAVGSTSNPSKDIKQEIIRVNQDKKYETLVNELYARDGSIIVFVKTKHGADKMARKLQNADIDADAIHGDLKQNKRERVIKAYRNKQFRVLVATDVVARGLDVPHVEHVINYDLPQMPEDYIHRIGRTARAGATGNALCLISPQDGRLWSAIERLMDPNAKPSNDDFKGGRGGNNKGRGGYKGNGGGGKFAKKPRRDGDKERSYGEKPAFNKGKPYKGKGKPFGERSEDGNRRPQRPSDNNGNRPARKDHSEGGNSWSKDRKPHGDRPHRAKRDDNRDHNRNENAADRPKARTNRSESWKNGDQPLKAKRHDGNRSDRPFDGKRDGENKGNFKGKKFSGEKKSFDKSKAPKSGGKPFKKKPRKAA
ncbi:MAG: DEAD/DEAH box helicase [Alphaproteobacteria bacterium]